MNVVTYRELGVRRVINGGGTYTLLGGSLMAQEVIEAMDEASKRFVLIDELYDKVGEVVAKIIGSEAAYITSGAAAGLVLAAATCITGRDVEKMRCLPVTSGMQNEIIVQRLQRNVWLRHLPQAGAKMIEVGDEEDCTQKDIEDAITGNTVAIAYWITMKTFGKGVSLEEVIEIARKYNLYTILDAAAELPPIENLRKFLEMGVDLVIFSGGKAIRGPNDTGIICGSKELIEACRMQSYPHEGFLGRPFKVSKEQIIGLVTALRRFVSRDPKIDEEKREAKVKYIVEHLKDVQNIKVEKIMPDLNRYWSHHWPRAQITLNERALGLTAKKIADKLREGDPIVWLNQVDNKLIVNPFGLLDGDEEIIVERIKEIILKPRRRVALSL
jgi:L-seryl-tRNA(Ser) seleniumtransferase